LRQKLALARAAVTVVFQSLPGQLLL
jgi:hypothetical protein